MKLYQRKTLLSDNADFAFFADRYSDATWKKSPEPFLLVRRDDSRLLVVTDDGRIMLCMAEPPNIYSVSYASWYLDGTRTFLGLSHELSTKVEYFIDPHLAIQAIQAFFEDREMADYANFPQGLPEPEIIAFPTQIQVPVRVAREHREMKVTITPELQADMKEVCLYLDEVANDRDEKIDFDDAIQIGSLCGGRMNRRSDIYYFSYYPDNGEVWSFEVPRTVLDGIADGSFKKLTVKASIPKVDVEKTDQPKE